MQFLITDTNESLRGHHGSSLLHIRSGIKLLAETLQQDANSKPLQRFTCNLVPLADLEIYFNRLDLQAVAVC